MAIELKKFQAELTKLEDDVNSAFGERKTVNDSEGNLKKLLDGAKLAIGDRVGELRTQGKPVGKDKGFVIADFDADPEVKKALDLVKATFKNYTAMETRKIANHAAIKAIYARYVDLAKRIDTEITDRKKKLFEPKSLPDMVKLAKKIHDEIDETGGLKDESIKDAASAATPKVGGLEAAFNTNLQIEINKKGAFRANAAVAELTAKFQPRLLKLRWDKANSLGLGAEKAAAAALDAKKNSDLKLAKDQIKIAVDKSLEMNTIVTDYSEAYNKNKSFLQQNPDHATIFKVVSGLTALSNRVLKAVSAAQSTVG